MCGIAGFKVNKAANKAALDGMLNALYHRGPDASGYYQGSGYLAGMRRLSINDLQHGDQPLYNRSKSVALLYNGEIYNSPQLRYELEMQGIQFRTKSDGEVICHLYDLHGLDLFEMLDGMYAVALWDESLCRLVLARDIPGEKPLYYSKLSDTELVFSSELKSLKRYPGLQCSLNRQALWDCPSFLWVPEPETVYENVYALPRGSILVADNSGIRSRAIANVFNADAIESDDDSIVAETHRVVTEAITSRLLSDVPVGCFLSGGLDSSIVTTIASRELGTIDTFSVGFEDLYDPYHGRVDESVQAAEYAAKLGTRHHAVHVTAESFRRHLADFCRYGDQPFAVSSGLGILAIAEAARDAGIKVLLSGDCADECFGGYSWYAYLEQAARCMPLAEEECVSFQNVGQAEEERLAAMACYDGPQRAWAWHYYAHEREKAALFDRDWQQGLASSIRHFSRYKTKGEWCAEDYIRQDREFYLPYEMLRKVDRMTMAYSVEGRVPFSAPAVLSHAEKLSYPQMVRDGKLKWALRQAFSDILPRDLVARPKHGFNVPIDHWLKNEWRDLLAHAFSKDSALARLGVIHNKSFLQAEKMLHDPKRLNGHSLFCFVMMNMWLEQE